MAAKKNQLATHRCFCGWCRVISWALCKHPSLFAVKGGWSGKVVVAIVGRTVFTLRVMDCVCFVWGHVRMRPWWKTPFMRANGKINFCYSTFSQLRLMPISYLIKPPARLGIKERGPSTLKTVIQRGHDGEEIWPILAMNSFLPFTTTDEPKTLRRS